MKVTYCDLCEQLIPLHAKKSILLLHDLFENKDEVDGYSILIDLIKRHELIGNKMKVYEICPKCRDIVNHFLKLRKKELEKLSKEIEKLYREEKK